MKVFTLTLSLVVFLVARKDALAESVTFMLERSVEMPAGCQPLKWTVDIERQKIRFQVTSDPGADWVAVGLSENGGMKGADMMIVKDDAYDGDGNEPSFEILDSISLDYVRPEPDVLQNVKMLQASRDDDDRIVAVLERDLYTCDLDDLRVEPYKQHVICASGRLDSKGTISYHGRQRSSALVNLMLDEELLMDRKFDRLVDSRKGVEVTSGVTMHGDPATETSPFAMDIKMPGLDIDPSVRTSYRCRVVQIPRQFKVVAYESVWGNGTSLVQEPQMDYLHHQNLYSCDPSRIDPAVLDGQSFDCLNDMPGCDSIFNHAKSGLIQVPAGTHVGIDAGIVLMMVHYDNVHHIPIQNDRSGIRFWVLPDSQQNETTPGQIVNHNGMVETIRIPADPLQREYDLEFMISSAATRAVLPPEGVQVFGAGMHMHNAGIRARLQHIRNGKHIEDIYDTRSFDYERQAPTLKRWRLLPGDALIMTCTYRPHPEKDIIGGLGANDEMCQFGIGFAPKVPEYPAAVGYLVRPDQAFLNSFIGEAPENVINAFTPYEFATYPPDSRDIVSLQDFRENICDTLIRDKALLYEFEYSDPNVYALYILVGSFFLCLWIEKAIPAFRNMDEERKRRNAVCCVLQIVFPSVAVIPLLVLAAPILTSHETFQAYDIESHNTLRGIMNTQVLLYVLELFYRIRIRVEVVIHRVLTVALFVFLNYIAAYSFSAEFTIKLASVLILLALLDQPRYLALLTKYLGFDDRSWWPGLCQWAAVWYVVSKTSIISWAIFIMVQFYSYEDTSWLISEHSFSKWISTNDGVLLTPEMAIVVVSILLVGLCADQVYTCRVLLLIANKQKERPTLKRECTIEEDQECWKP